MRDSAHVRPRRLRPLVTKMWAAGTILPMLRCLAAPHKHQEKTMGSTTDKVKGAANEAIGKAKQKVGEAVGSDKLKVEGLVQEAKGEG